MSDEMTKAQIMAKASAAVGKTLRKLIRPDALAAIERQVQQYGNRRKGFFGELVEKHVFGVEPNSRPEADFAAAMIELKTTPLKRHTSKTYVSKERLVFSMIDYKAIIAEKWETSSFLKKNQHLLILFYLWIKDHNLLDFEFKFAHLLDLLADISTEDALQIRKDWEYIVDKIRRGEAHLLSEGDTYYLGACTKAATSSTVRDQGLGAQRAKPRAFSLKQQYLNFIIQKHLLKKDVTTDSIFKKTRRVATVEQAMHDLFTPFIGKTDLELRRIVRWKLGKNKPKNYARLLVEKMLGLDIDRIEELEKANVTLKVVVLEAEGALKESISFRAFDYGDLISQTWYDDKKEIMSDLFEQLETKKFFFVVFQKQVGSDDIILKRVRFWNFPAADMPKAKAVWEKTVELIRSGLIVHHIERRKNKDRVFTHFPGSSYNGVVHVRPHGTTRRDTSRLPVTDQLTGREEHTKQSFWIDAKYIQGFLQ